jgi:hypothetical protein
MPCYLHPTKDGGTMFICGEFGPHCAACGDAGDAALCDYPVGDGKTCDAALCDLHAAEVAPNIHYCPGHLTMWNAYRESGAEVKELANVVPFKSCASMS